MHNSIKDRYYKHQDADSSESQFSKMEVSDKEIIKSDEQEESDEEVDKVDEEEQVKSKRIVKEVCIRIYIIMIII